jgi:hypothetical protein
MTQALYAHMNNKTIKIKKERKKSNWKYAQYKGQVHVYSLYNTSLEAANSIHICRYMFQKYFLVMFDTVLPLVLCKVRGQVKQEVHKKTL